MIAIGKKMRQLRLAKDWTLAQLAKHSGIALSSLSRIETGRMTGTLESHIKIARSLGVRLAELYADVDPAAWSVEYLAAASTSEKLFSSKGSLFTLLVSGALRKKMLPLLIHLGQGKNSQPEHLAAGTERFLYLMKGKLQVTTGKEKREMHPGDSLYFHASLPHSFRNVGNVPILALSITCPAAL